tara:strand:+ start:502 stop:1089 length:588 start_codon:yes stop_codon:yes gene_type:complete
MFNGIIFNTGEVKTIKRYKKSILVSIKTKMRFSNRDIGSSISCNGVCLTIEKIKNKSIYFYISNETIKRSNFQNLKIKNIINLEKSLIYGQNVSGNFAQGHVDTTAKIRQISIIDKTWLLKLEIRNKRFQKYLVEKASISINGVSLTISNISKKYFYLNIIPHTLKLTNLKNLKVKDIVNVELDIFGKYIHKYSI